jgi:hypothetical protein
MQFTDKWEAFDWMYKKQLGRRNLTPEQKKYLIGKLYEARKHTRGGTGANQYNTQSRQNDDTASGRTVKIIASEQGVGTKTVERAEHFAQGLDKAEAVVPGFRQEILSGEVKAPQNSIAEIRNMEDEEEVKTAVRMIKNPNIPYKPRNKQTEEEKQIADRVNRIVEIQNDSNRDTSITIDDLAELVEEDGKDYVSSLRNMLVVRSTLLIGENRQVISNVLENIIFEINKVKELLK